MKGKDPDVSGDHDLQGDSFYVRELSRESLRVKLKQTFLLGTQQVSSQTCVTVKESPVRPEGDRVIRVAGSG